MGIFNQFTSHKKRKNTVSNFISIYYYKIQDRNAMMYPASANWTILEPKMKPRDDSLEYIQHNVHSFNIDLLDLDIFRV